jgi:hypothetical protein
VKVGIYKGKEYYHNDYLGEIFTKCKTGELRKVSNRHYHRLYNTIKWENVYNPLANDSINRMNGFNPDGTLNK